MQHARAVLAPGAEFHLPAEMMRHELHPVADAEHRDAQRKNLRIKLRRAALINTRRPAGEDDAVRLRARRLPPPADIERTISEYTWHSRMRRAMTWVYCEPKSRMRIFECADGVDISTIPDGGPPRAPVSAPSGLVGSFRSRALPTRARRKRIEAVVASPGKIEGVTSVQCILEDGSLRRQLSRCVAFAKRPINAQRLARDRTGSSSSRLPARRFSNGDGERHDRMVFA